MIALRRPKAAFPIEGDLADSSAGQRYAIMVQRLLAQSGSSRQVLVTSAGDGEGKTVTAVNLAFALHAHRIPVLLAEISFERPRFSEIFAPSPLSHGIEDVIAEGVPLPSIICVRDDNNLNVAMVKHRQATNDLLSPGPAFERLLQEARSSYEWTIFDAPSVGSLPHIRSLAASVGLVLMVARARQTRASALQQALVHIAHPRSMVLLNDE